MTQEELAVKEYSTQEEFEKDEFIAQFVHNPIEEKTFFTLADSTHNKALMLDGVIAIGFIEEGWELLNYDKWELPEL